MLLKTCTVCSVPLGSGGKQCGRCGTPYCGPACQKKHWEEGGHDKLCRKIKKGGGAERCYAQKNYAEAVAAAVKECAEDTKGQTCYICTESIEPRTKEGLVRMCSCGDRDGVASGTAGVVHVSCLVRQAQIACDDEMSNEGEESKWGRWDACRVCGQRFNGAVALALGWACWRTYLSRPLGDEMRQVALSQLGVGLQKTRRYEAAVAAYQLNMAELRRYAPRNWEAQFNFRNNIATLYSLMGRPEEALNEHVAVMEGRRKLFGAENKNTIHCSINVANMLLRLGMDGGDLQNLDRARELLEVQLPLAKRILPATDEMLLIGEPIHAQTILYDPRASRNDKLGAKARLAECVQKMRRALGPQNLSTREMELALRTADGHIPPPSLAPGELWPPMSVNVKISERRPLA